MPQRLVLEKHLPLPFLFYNASLRNVKSLLDCSKKGRRVRASTKEALDRSQGVLWQNGQITVLEALPGESGSWPEAINDLGHVVGDSSEAGRGYAVVLWRDGEVVNLSAMFPEYNLAAALAINNAGEILVEGESPEFPGNIRPFVLTPKSGGGGGSSTSPSYAVLSIFNFFRRWKGLREHARWGSSLQPPCSEDLPH